VANTFSSPMMPNVPNIFAPWTYDEILITVSGQQHTPVAQPKSLVTRQGCEGRVANWGQGGGKQWSTIRLDLLRMRCPLAGTIVLRGQSVLARGWAWCMRTRDGWADRRRARDDREVS
jgi:hypothetical protein